MTLFFLQIFISAATMPTQRDKRVSPSWLTTGCCSALNFDQPYIYLMQENNWTSVYLVIDAATPMTPVIAFAVARAVQKMNGTQHTDFTIPRDGRNEQTFDSLLREFNRSSRGKHLLHAEPPIDHAPFLLLFFANVIWQVLTCIQKQSFILSNGFSLILLRSLERAAKHFGKSNQSNRLSQKRVTNCLDSCEFVTVKQHCRNKKNHENVNIWGQSMLVVFPGVLAESGQIVHVNWRLCKSSTVFGHTAHTDFTAMSVYILLLRSTSQLNHIAIPSCSGTCRGSTTTIMIK